ASGSVFGSVGAFLIMLGYGIKLRRADASADLVSAKPAVKGKLGGTYRQIFRLSVPIALTAMTVQFFYTFDSQFFYSLTQAAYVSSAEADSAFNALGIKAQAIAGIPPILAIALSQSVIPVISSAYAVGNLDEVRRQTSLVMRIVLFTGVPAALVLTVAAPSVTGLIYTPGGSGVVAALTAGTIFQITMLTTNSILFGLDKARQAMYHTATGMLIKAGLSVALGPFLGVYGLIAASTVSFILITWWNVATVRKTVAVNVLGSRWIPYLGAVALTAAAGRAVDMAGLRLLEPLPYKLACFITAAAAGTVIGMVYLALLVMLGVVRREDAASFPGPLRKLFTWLLRMRSDKRDKASM
ncbi:lipid II flippase MurJ, partial [Paenibacillus darwinianus]